MNHTKHGKGHVSLRSHTKKKTIHDLEYVLLIIKICQKVSFHRKNLANKNTTPLLQDG